ncbi:hypothetical protein Tco_1291718 [Tanacetum coccineum]
MAWWRTSCWKQSEIHNSEQCNSITPLNLRSALSIYRELVTHPEIRVKALEVLDLITLQTGGAETDHAGANNRVCEVSVLSTTREGARVTILPHNLKNPEEAKTSIRLVTFLSLSYLSYLRLLFKVLKGKQTWWCRVDGDPLTRADVGVYR